MLGYGGLKEINLWPQIGMTLEPANCPTVYDGIAAPRELWGTVGIENTAQMSGNVNIANRNEVCALRLRHLLRLQPRAMRRV